MFSCVREFFPESIFVSTLLPVTACTFSVSWIKSCLLIFGLLACSDCFLDLTFFLDFEFALSDTLPEFSSKDP